MEGFFLPTIGSYSVMYANQQMYLAIIILNSLSSCPSERKNVTLTTRTNWNIHVYDSRRGFSSVSCKRNSNNEFSSLFLSLAFLNALSVIYCLYAQLYWCFLYSNSLVKTRLVFLYDWHSLQDVLINLRRFCCCKL